MRKLLLISLLLVSASCSTLEGAKKYAIDELIAKRAFCVTHEGSKFCLEKQEEKQ